MQTLRCLPDIRHTININWVAYLISGHAIKINWDAYGISRHAININWVAYLISGHTIKINRDTYRISGVALKLTIPPSIYTTERYTDIPDIQLYWKLEKLTSTQQSITAEKYQDLMISSHVILNFIEYTYMPYPCIPFKLIQSPQS